MAEIERAACEACIAALAVPSSVTTEGFYAKLGNMAILDSYYGEERTIIMERRLVPQVRDAWANIAREDIPQ